MAHGFYHYLKQFWKKPDSEVLREKMIEWRKGQAVTKVDKPLRLDRARALGYKDKKGIVVARVRILRGGHKKPRPIRGRRSKRMHTRKNLKMNYQWIAEQRVQRKFTNLEVLNSYQIGKDGKHYFYEVILLDPEKAEIKNDKNLKWVTKSGNKNRVSRGLTSAGKKSRGLRAGKGRAHKVRPSVGSKGNKGK